MTCKDSDYLYHRLVILADAANDILPCKYGYKNIYFQTYKNFQKTGQPVSEKFAYKTLRHEIFIVGTEH